MKNIIRAIGAALAVVALSACASGARPDQLIAPVTDENAFAQDHQLKNNLTVDQVKGGSETNPLWMSNVSDSQFQAGLEQSLKNAGLLAESSSKAGFVVAANLEDLKRPMAGIDMNVTVSVRYTVTPTAGGAPIFDEVVTTTGTGTFSDAFVGVERLRIANEAAVRTNIGEFLRRLKDEVPANATLAIS